MMKIEARHNFYRALANPITEVLGIEWSRLRLPLGRGWLSIKELSFGITMTEQPMTVPGIMVFFGMLIGASDPVRKLSGVITGST